MATALTIGGARFMGRFTVEGLLDDDHDVTLFTRGRTPIPFGADAVDHVRGDRTDRAALEAAADAVDPDVVFDFAAFTPDDVRAATEVFADVDAYVYVSSTHAYRRTASIPLVEGTTPLEPCSPQQAADESHATYGPRKAEGDRIVFEAARAGVNAISVRPTAIYGPHDPTGRLDYWIDRVDRFDRIVVPGDAYRMPIHLGYVEDAARAIRLVATSGEPGEAYNVAARNHLTYDDLLGLLAGALDTTVEVVHATDRELAPVGLSVTDFPLCEPYPYLVSTEKLAGLGWNSTPFVTGIPNAVDDYLEREGDGRERGPARDVEEEVLEELSAYGSTVGAG